MIAYLRRPVPSAETRTNGTGAEGHATSVKQRLTAATFATLLRHGSLRLRKEIQEGTNMIIV